MTGNLQLISSPRPETHKFGSWEVSWQPASTRKMWGTPDSWRAPSSASITSVAVAEQQARITRRNRAPYADHYQDPAPSSVEWLIMHPVDGAGLAGFGASLR